VLTKIHSKEDDFKHVIYFAASFCGTLEVSYATIYSLLIRAYEDLHTVRRYSGGVPNVCRQWWYNAKENT
jgi:hypothetical protein